MLRQALERGLRVTDVLWIGETGELLLNFHSERIDAKGI